LTNAKKKIIEKPKVEEISKKHDFTSFDCGRPSINEYLTEYAWQNHRSGRSKTWVVCGNDNDNDNEVVGFYSICPAEISYEEVVVSIKSGQPKGQRIPAYKIAQLGVDKDYQGTGLGKALFKDALLNCLGAAKKVGGRVIIIDALDDEVSGFYIKYGFQPATQTSNLMMLKISDIEESLK